MSQVNSNFSGYDTTYYGYWKFGDGDDTGDEQNPLHVYVHKGNYTVTLKVTDNEGLTGNDTTIATISEEDTTNPIVEIIKYRFYDPNQEPLIHPDIYDWLPEEHLAFFVDDRIGT